MQVSGIEEDVEQQFFFFLSVWTTGGNSVVGPTYPWIDPWAVGVNGTPLPLGCPFILEAMVFLALAFMLLFGEYSIK